MPVTIPVEPTVATDVVAEDHEPPEGVATSVIVRPVQTLPGPDITADEDVTTTKNVTEQPVGSV